MKNAIRRCIGEVILEKLVIHRGTAPPHLLSAAQAYNTVALDLLLIDIDYATKNIHRVRRPRLRALVNARVILGSWSHNDIRDEQIHLHVDDKLSDDDIRCICRTEITQCLYPKAWATWNRSRWKGDGDVARQACLLFSWHQVGQVVFERLLQLNIREEAPQARPAFVRFGLAVAAAADGYVSEEEAAGQVVAAGQVEAVGQVAAAAAPGLQTGFDWAAFNRTQKIAFGKWVSSRPLGRLWCISRVMHDILTPLADVEIFKAGASFAEANDVRVLRGKPRQYKPALDFAGVDECAAAWKLVDFLCEAWSCISVPLRSSGLRKYLFSICAIVSCGIEATQQRFDFGRL